MSDRDDMGSDEAHRQREREEAAHSLEREVLGKGRKGSAERIKKRRKVNHGMETSPVPLVVAFCLALLASGAGLCVGCWSSRCYTMRPTGFASHIRSAYAFARPGPRWASCHASSYSPPYLGRIPRASGTQEWNRSGEMGIRGGIRGLPEIPGLHRAFRFWRKEPRC